MSYPAPQTAAPGRIWLRAALVVLGLTLVSSAIWALRHLAGEPSAVKRQVARIAILPDTPPPPPPPPPPRKEEVARPEARPQPQDNTPKPPAPDNAPLKMEGAAGNGPSAFQSGSVSQDYQGGKPTVGAAAGGGAVDRAAERLYAGTVRQMLRDEIERQLPPDAGEILVSFALWISADGRLSRWELDPAAASASSGAALQQALERSAAQLQLPAPNSVSQPMRFRLTLRSAG
jgi:hypothetical protein